MFVRKDHLRASKVMQDRALKNPKINILWNTEAEEVMGESLMTIVRIKNNQTNDEKTLDANGLFYAIGHEPNTSFLNQQLNLMILVILLPRARRWKRRYRGFLLVVMFKIKFIAKPLLLLVPVVWLH